MKRFFTISASLIALITGIVFFEMCTTDKNPTENNNTVSIEPVSPKKKSLQSEGTMETATDNSDVQKYILHFDKEKNAVSLTVKYSGGTELIYPIESIKPEFLENEDIEALTKGIELNSKEEMYILIEDYSS